MDSVTTYLKDEIPMIRKYIPLQFENPIKIALQYFPELKNISIKFKLKENNSPLSARPTLFSFFKKAQKRKYIIFISTSTHSKFDSILLKNLTFNSQIGVIGHELSHISFYNKRNSFYFIKLVVMHLSKKSIDKFEYNTDMLCIQHGLGYQLLSWSTEVRMKLNLIQWKGIKQMQANGRERYMNPQSIIDTIQALKMYVNVAKPTN
ncbi:MAG: hypothetical protein SFY56_02745 [Bacteroidota bacterium]|nr:hypothetical protein [Bacteroidota bacterium]